MPPVGVGMYEGAVVWLAGEALGAPFPPDPAAPHADVPSANAAARAKIADRMALTS
jgi:hypothetical protein